MALALMRSLALALRSWEVVGISEHRNFGTSERRCDGTTVRRNVAREGGRFSAPLRASSIYMYTSSGPQPLYSKPPCSVHVKHCELEWAQRTEKGGFEYSGGFENIF